jgi:hypothetical protein
LAQKIDFSEILWQSMGLPEIGAKYSLVGGKSLYREETAEGEISVQKQEYTGEFHIGTHLTDPDGKNNYLITFKGVLFKGELVGIEVEELTVDDGKQQQQANEEFARRLARENSRSRAWWYRFFYKPFKFILRCSAFCLIWVLMFFRWIITRLVLFLTPF